VSGNGKGTGRKIEKRNNTGGVSGQQGIVVD